MHYHVVFDLNQVGFKPENIAPLALGILFVLIGIVFVLFRQRLIKWGLVARAMPFVFLAFSVFWLIGVLCVSFEEFTVASEALKSGKAKVIEGQVSSFRPMFANATKMEHFCVKDTCFAYSDYIMTAGFNRTSKYGGPIREGLPVRVTYLGNIIVKLEVADGH